MFIIPILPPILEETLSIIPILPPILEETLS